RGSWATPDFGRRSRATLRRQSVGDGRAIHGGQGSGRRLRNLRRAVEGRDAEMDHPVHGSAQEAPSRLGGGVRGPPDRWARRKAVRPSPRGAGGRGLTRLALAVSKQGALVGSR